MDYSNSHIKIKGHFAGNSTSMRRYTSHCSVAPSMMTTLLQV